MSYKLEDTHQIEFFKWLKRFPEVYEVTAHIPNGGKRDIKEAAKFKLMGVKAGMPDIMMMIPSQNYHGLFIELKVLDGDLSPAQKARIPRLRKNGYRCEVCYSWFEAKDVVLDYLKDTDYVKQQPISLADYKASLNGYGPLVPRS